MFLKTSGGAIARLPPSVVGLAAHPLCMEYRTMAVFLLRSQPVAQPQWCRRGHGDSETNLLRFLLMLWIKFQLLERRQWLTTSLPAPPEQISVQPLVPPWVSRAAISMQGFITLSARVNDFHAKDIRIWATLVMAIRDTDPRVPATVAEIVAALQQIVVFFVWRMKPTCFCVLDIY